MTPVFQWLTTLILFGLAIIGIHIARAIRRRHPADAKHPEDTLQYWKTLAEEESRKRTEVTAVVAGVMRERDAYKKWWWEHAAQHDAAQTLLAEEIRRCYRLLSKHNIKIREKGDLLELPQVFHRATAPEALLEKRGRIEGERTPLHAEMEAAEAPQIPELEAKGVAKDDSNA